MRHRPKRASALLIELREHVPFSVAAVAVGLVVAGAICILGFRGETVVPATGHADRDDPARLFFHLFHPVHMLFSGAATAAMFSRFDKSVAKSVVIGLIGAIGVCGISDIMMPHVALILLGTSPGLHICVIEHPDLVLPFAGIGVLTGIATAGSERRATIVSHSMHVLASTMASIFYMVGPLGTIAWIDRIGPVFLFVVLAVIGPCCVSDIIFPVGMSHAARAEYKREGHSH
ncbi:MAG: hypothetical protein ACE5E6_06675 [Phycisphaerae bacterium]